MNSSSPTSRHRRRSQSPNKLASSSSTTIGGEHHKAASSASPPSSVAAAAAASPIRVNKNRSSWSKSRISIRISAFLILCITLNTFVVVFLHPSSSSSKSNTNTNMETSNTKPSIESRNYGIVVVVAHVVSLIKCTKQTSVTGFLDAAAVLRHSIHKISIHTPSSGSKYSYKMYAIVHDSCQSHSLSLDKLGYTSLIKPSPIVPDDIQPGWYRDHVEGENCCGSAEFIKLYAYTLMDHPITVHWDMDVAIFQPMDDLFDSMLHDKDTFQGQLARSKLDVQHPDRPLPPIIDAFFTRDVTSAQPWEIRQGVQGGFLVSRPSLSHFDKYVSFIQKGNYTGGRGPKSGWDGLGYGGFQGAMAYQGVVAYFYDQIATNTAVELDLCVWNQVVADVIWRGPNKMEHYGQCREYPTRMGDSHEMNTPINGRCKDCRSLPIDQVKSAHYTACKKPWECTLPYPRKPSKRQKNQKHRLQELTNITTCGLLFRKWFDLRTDFEETVYQQVTAQTNGTKLLFRGRDGSYEKQYFGGYCEHQFQYIPMEPPPEDFNITQMYGV